MELQGMTGGYWRFRWGNNGLQLVTIGYRRLEEVTWAYKRFQGVTGG